MSLVGQVSESSACRAEHYHIFPISKPILIYILKGDPNVHTRSLDAGPAVVARTGPYHRNFISDRRTVLQIPQLYIGMYCLSGDLVSSRPC